MTLTVSPEFNREIGIPRVAAIEYPYGRPVWQVNDDEGQRKVLLEALSVLEKTQEPGQVFHLPFEWPEEPKETKWHPPVATPVIKLYLDEIRKAGVEARK